MQTLMVSTKRNLQLTYVQSTDCWRIYDGATGESYKYHTVEAAIADFFALESAPTNVTEWPY